MDSFLDRMWHRNLRRPYKLHVTEHGQTNGQGATIILLHGIAASSENWHELLPLLESSYHIITIDLLGFGASPKPQWGAYTMEDHVRSLHKTITKLRLQDEIIMVGHSLGSLLATRYSRTHPRHIKRLLLLSSPIYPPLATITSPLARKRTELFLNIYKFLRSNPRVTPESFKRLSRILPLPKSIITNPQTWIPFMRSLEHCIEQQTLLDDIVAISQPIDMFYGTLDQVAIPYNIQQVKHIKDVTIHKLVANHDLTKRYAKAVSNVLQAS